MIATTTTTTTTATEAAIRVDGPDTVPAPLPAPPPAVAKPSFLDEAFAQAASLVTHLRKPEVQQRLQGVSLVVASVVFVGGPATGPQSTFGALARRGVFSDKCDQVDSGDGEGGFPCVSQHQAIELSTDVILSICYTLRVVLGVAQDRLGAYRIVPLELLVWVIGTGLSGFAPSNGIMWSFGQGMANIVSLGAYGAMSLVHLRDACPDVGDFNFWSVIINAFWDVAVLLNFGIAAWLDWTAIPFWMSYIVLACVLGLPVTAGFALWMQRHDHEAAIAAARLSSFGGGLTSTGAERKATPGGYEVEGPPAEVGRESPSPAPPPSAAAEQSDPAWLAQFAEQRRREEEQYRQAAAAELQHRAFRAELTTIVTSADFWLFTGSTAALATASYFFIANIGTVARVMYATTSAEAEEAHAASTIMMAALGATLFVPIRLLQRTNTPTGVAHVTLLSAAQLLVAALLLMFARGRVATFVAYSLMFVWRIWSYGITVPFFSWRFGHCSAALGVSYGLLYTVGGVVSLIVGPIASNALYRDPEKNFATVIGWISGVAVVLQAVFAAVLLLSVSGHAPAGAAVVPGASCGGDAAMGTNATVPVAGEGPGVAAADSLIPGPVAVSVAAASVPVAHFEGMAVDPVSLTPSMVPHH